MNAEGLIKGTTTLSTILVDKFGQIIANNNTAKYQASVLGGNVYSGGMTLTSINNATFSTGGLDATTTPIIGVWNPTASGKNLVILQTKLQAVLTALQATGAGSFMWATSNSNGAITTGKAPFNRFTLNTAGSVAKDVSGVALTGLTNTLVVRDCSGLSGGANYNASLLGTAIGFMPPSLASVDNIDGSIIVPQGGVLALLCTTNPPVAVSVASSILWEEITV